MNPNLATKPNLSTRTYINIPINFINQNVFIIFITKIKCYSLANSRKENAFGET